VLFRSNDYCTDNQFYTFDMICNLDLLEVNDQVHHQYKFTNPAFQGCG